MTNWKPEDNPEWAIKKLREIAETRCAQFGESENPINPFCGKCDSCIAGRTLVGLTREWYKDVDSH